MFLRNYLVFFCLFQKDYLFLTFSFQKNTFYHFILILQIFIIESNNLHPVKQDNCLKISFLLYKFCSLPSTFSRGRQLSQKLNQKPSKKLPEENLWSQKLRSQQQAKLFPFLPPFHHKILENQYPKFNLKQTLMSKSNTHFSIKLNFNIK